MKSSNLWYKYVMLCLILWQVWEFPESFQQYVKIEKARLKACNSFHGLCLKKRCHSKLLKDQIKKKVNLEKIHRIKFDRWLNFYFCWKKGIFWFEIILVTLIFMLTSKSLFTSATQINSKWFLLLHLLNMIH